jgi:hypothetical protein
VQVQTNSSLKDIKTCVELNAYDKLMSRLTKIDMEPLACHHNTQEDELGGSLASMV